MPFSYAQVKCHTSIKYYGLYLSSSSPLAHLLFLDPGISGSTLEGQYGLLAMQARR